MRHSLSYSARAASVFLILAIGFFVPIAETAHAANTQAADPLKEATVNLYCRFKSGNKIASASGSGVFVGDRGVILTNAHVAQYFLLQGAEGKTTGSCTVRSGSPAKDQYTASVLYISPNWLESSLAKTNGNGEHDFALLYVTGAVKGELPLSFPKIPMKLFEDADEEDIVTITGYPTEKLKFNAIRDKLKALTATSTITSVRTFSRNPSADALIIASSRAGSAGVSGGPVVSTSGEVIGIATAKSTKGDGRTLRAITLPYINRAIQTETTLPLNLILWGDLAARASSTAASLSPDMIKTIRNSIFKKK